MPVRALQVGLGHELGHLQGIGIRQAVRYKCGLDKVAQCVKLDAGGGWGSQDGVEVSEFEILAINDRYK
jgi:hypothetical protein